MGSVVPLTSPTALKLAGDKVKTAERSRLVELYEHYRDMRHETIRRLVIDKNRIDVLGIVVLGLDLQPFHVRMLQFQFQHKATLQLAFRGAGKTTSCTVLKAIHMIVKDRNIRIALVSKTKGNSQGFLKEIKGHLETNEKLIEIFGKFYDPHTVTKWDDSAIEVVGRTEVHKEPTITCLGIETAIASKHYDVHLVDDLVDEENSRTQYMRDKIKSWFYQVLEPTLNPPHPQKPHCGESHRLGTRYHYADIYGHWKDGSSDGSGGELKDSTQVIPLLDEEGRTPWPERYSPKWAREKQINAGTIIFNAQYQCHSDETEFLTRDGWRRFEAIAEDAELATFDLEGRVEWQRSRSRTCLPYDGDMLRLRSNTLNALLTPNHQMLARPADYPARGDWRRVDAARLGVLKSGRTGRVSIFSGIEYEGTEAASFTIPPPVAERAFGAGRDALTCSMDAFLRFLGFFITEGSTKSSSRGDVRLAQNPGPVLDQMRVALSEMGLTWKEYGTETVALCVRHIGLWCWLREHVKTDSADVRIPPFVFETSARQRRILLGALLDGDGHTVENVKRPSYQFTTASRGLADDVQALTTLLRFDVSLTTHPPRRVAKSGRSYVQAHPTHRLCLRASNCNGILPEQVTTEPYKGNVVCFSVPNRTLVTRLGGKVLTSGNCDTEAMKGEVFRYDDCHQIAVESPDWPSESDLKIFMGVDLAIGEKEKNDFFAIAVIGCQGKVQKGLRSDFAFYLLDYFLGHLRFSGQTGKIIELYRRWRPIACGIETVQYQEAQLQATEDEIPDARLYGIKTDKDKMTRAWKLSPMFEQGRAHFKKGMANPMIDQLVLFPNHANDDGFDALDMAVQMAKKRPRRRRRTVEPGVL